MTLFRSRGSQLSVTRAAAGITALFAVAFILALLPRTNVFGAAQSDRSVILSATTSTQDSGLLDVLVPLFEKQSRYTVKTVAVGTGQALALAAKGAADVALVHAPSLEKKCCQRKAAQPAFSHV
jgi:tungstate transport system substrate-binding protein